MDQLARARRHMIARQVTLQPLTSPPAPVFATTPAAAVTTTPIRVVTPDPVIETVITTPVVTRVAGRITTTTRAVPTTTAARVVASVASVQTAVAPIVSSASSISSLLSATQAAAQKDSEKSGGANTTVIAIIVVVAIIVALAAGFFIWRKYQNNKRNNAVAPRPASRNSGYVKNKGDEENMFGSAGVFNNTRDPYDANSRIGGNYNEKSYGAMSEKPFALQAPPAGHQYHNQHSEYNMPHSASANSIHQYQDNYSPIKPPQSAVTAHQPAYPPMAPAQLAPIPPVMIAGNTSRPVSVAGSTRGGDNVSPFGDPATEGKLFIVTRTFERSMSDELIIRPGDRVQIVLSYDDGWCLGVNLDQQSEEKPNELAKGVFPRNCVEEYDSTLETIDEDTPLQNKPAEVERAPTLPPLSDFGIDNGEESLSSSMSKIGARNSVARKSVSPVNTSIAQQPLPSVAEHVPSPTKTVAASIYGGFDSMPTSPTEEFSPSMIHQSQAPVTVVSPPPNNGHVSIPHSISSASTSLGNTLDEFPSTPTTAMPTPSPSRLSQHRISRQNLGTGSATIPAPSGALAKRMSSLSSHRDAELFLALDDALSKKDIDQDQPKLA